MMLAAIAAGCGDVVTVPRDGGPPLDAATDVGPDIGTPMADVGSPDAGPGDAAGPLDAAMADLGPTDAEPSDSSATDTGATDTGATDTGASGGTGCGVSPGANDRKWTLQHDGRTREFFVHLPPGYDPNTPTPVVFDFHGRVFTATLQLGLTHMRDVADDEGFIAVHPEGIGRTWNGGVCCGEASTSNVDDVGFVSAMIDELNNQLCIDDDRIFATGMSNGGFLSHRLACELSDRIAAIAPVAGVLGIAGCSPTRAMPVFHFHGTDDNVVGYNGIRGYLSVADSMDGWVTRNGCNPTSTVYFMQDDVTCESWTGCRDNAEVRLCTIDGGGHTWPGGTPIPGLGHTSQTIDASEVMWPFFMNHPRP